MDYIPLTTNSSVKKLSSNVGKKRKRSENCKAMKGPRDLQLLKRIRQFVGEMIPKSVDAEAVANELKKFYPEYRRKKAKEFTSAVHKTLEFLKRETNKSDDESSDLSEDVKFLVQYPDSNLMNQSISNMYKSSSKDDQNGTENSESTLQRKPIQKGKKKGKKESETPSGQDVKTTKSSSERTSAVKKKHEIQLQDSTITFKDVGGIDQEREDMFELRAQIQYAEVYEKLHLFPPRGFLLHGPPGSGKTLLAHAIAGELGLPMLKISSTELVKGVSGESEEKIREIFDQALCNAPCILFIDEIDAITPKRDTAQREMEIRIVAQLLICLDELSRKPASVKLVVIGATNRPEFLDPALRRAGRFDNEISLGIPDEESRIKILKVCCQNLELQPDFNYQDLARRTPGYVGADLMALTRKAGSCALRRILDKGLLSGSTQPESAENQTPYSPWFERPTESSTSLVDGLKAEDFLAALQCVQPSAKREGFATVPDVTWEDVGALKTIREELQMAIVEPINHRSEFESLGLPTSSGILLWGPPGCGKTLLAKAVANESGLNFISVKGPELMNMYVGESERAVRQCFQRARNAAPCVIFFDELDALCPKRSKDTAVSGASDRVVNQMLTEMDGMDSRKQVFVLAATNRPDIIDPAMMRPGRLDKVLYVGLPPPEDKVDILRTVTKNGSKPPLDADVQLEVIGHDNRCEGFTGADLAALVREASRIAYKCAKQNTDKSAFQNLKVKYSHFEEAFTQVRPSVSLEDQKMYDKMRNKI